MNSELSRTPVGKEITAWTITSAKTFLATKPVKVNSNQLSFTPNFSQDTVSFQKNCSTSISFVKSLLNIKGKDKLDTIRMIKNAILKKMGYKNPEALVLDTNLDNLKDYKDSSAGFNLRTGNLTFDVDLPIKDNIAIMYHEIDHMDKLVKLYKVILEHGNSYKVSINHDFYREMSKGVDTQDFDIVKWCKAIQEYSGITQNYNDNYRYYNNPLEVSAYAVEAKVKKILGLPRITARDCFPKNYISMFEILNSHGITDINKQEDIFNKAIYFCMMKNHDAKAIKLYINAVKGRELNSDETSYFRQKHAEIFRNIDSNYSKRLQKACLDVEEYFRKGFITLDEIANNTNIE